MGITHLWDTNIVIYFLQKQFPEPAEKAIDNLLKNSGPSMSAITEIELLCWKTATPDDLKILHQFIDDTFVYELERDIKLKTAAIRKQHRIKLPDAIIAATALVYDLTLVTRNTKDFTAIEGIQLFNPFDQYKKIQQP